jgi:hypothetical protein
MKIVGFFHICQKQGWERSFDMIFNSIKNYGLYDNTSEIYFIIINDYGTIIDNERFHLPKIKAIYGGHSSAYERATLRYMHYYATNSEACNLWYAHSKGVNHFGTVNETRIIDWVLYMCYFNFENWGNVIKNLQNYQVCGCNYSKEPQPHFSGNFWWAQSEYIKTLPFEIGIESIDPEIWLFKSNPSYKSLFDSNIDHYCENFARDRYVKK